ncbi:MAG: hypothetical protein IJ877_00860 [Candidatus Gastranaerophilales bacterium]|nr:hypothetical protein [Candidatus Gastranaerophilales bacterium]
MSELTNTEIEQAKKLASMSKISQILENIREVIARDRKQKQPLILRINEGFIFNIARKAIQEKDSTFIMSIAGESASGKTTLVNNAAKACLKSDTNNVYTVVSCDDYYKDASFELQSAGSYEKLFESGFSFDTPDAIDLDLMKEHLVKLKNGEEIYSPLYNFVTCVSQKDKVLKKPAKLILNEGLYVLNERLRDIIDVKIYVYTPFEIIKERWFSRATSRGKTGLAAQMQFHDVNQTAFRHIRPSMDTADVVINGMTTQIYIEDFINELIEAITSVTNSKHLSI